MRLMDSDNTSGQPVNLGNPNELSIVELVDRVVEMTRTGSPIERHPLPVDDPRRRKPDIGRAKALLGWEPTVDLQTGLESTVAWFSDPGNREVRPVYAERLIAAAE